MYLARFPSQDTLIRRVASTIGPSGKVKLAPKVKSEDDSTPSASKTAKKSTPKSSTKEVRR